MNEYRVEPGKGRHGQTSEEVPAVIQVSNSGSSKQSGNSGIGEKWSDSGCFGNRADGTFTSLRGGQ